MNEDKELITEIGDTARVSDPNREPPPSPQPPHQSGVNRTTCSLYFSDRTLLDRINEQLKHHPRASFSSLVVQLLQQTIGPLEELGKDVHHMKLDGIEVWL